MIFVCLICCGNVPLTMMNEKKFVVHSLMNLSPLSGNSKYILPGSRAISVFASLSAIVNSSAE